jgi:hypothetical protein
MSDDWEPLEDAYADEIQRKAVQQMSTDESVFPLPHAWR